MSRENFSQINLPVPDIVCRLCQHPMFEEKECVVLECGCKVHIHCILKFNLYNLVRYCPMCRQVITPSKFKEFASKQVPIVSGKGLWFDDFTLDECSLCQTVRTDLAAVYVANCNHPYHMDCLELNMSRYELKGCIRCDVPFSEYDKMYFTEILHDKDVEKILRDVCDVVDRKLFVL